MKMDHSNQRAIQAEIRQVTGLIQSRMCGELHMHEEFIPAAKAAARCSIFVTHDWSVNPTMCVFMQHGAGVTPGLWSIPPTSQQPASSPGLPSPPQAFSHSLACMSLIPYIQAAKKCGYSVLVMNPSTNRMHVQGHPVKILHSSSPEEHVMHVWSTYIQPSAANQIHFIAYDTSGLLVNYLLSTLPPQLYSRIGGIVFIDAPQANVLPPRTHKTDHMQSLLARRGVHFEPSSEPMFQLLSNASPRLCSTLSVGRGGSSDNSTAGSASLLHSVQSSTFVFLKSISSGLHGALDAIRATVPNKLVVTVNRARLTGQPYNNPYAVVTCVGQKKETVGNHRKTMDPEWNQTFSFPVTDSNATVLVKVKDKAFPLSTTVGCVSIALADVGWNRPWRKWFSLRHDAPRLSAQHGNGELELTLEWVHDPFVARTDSFLRKTANRPAPEPPAQDHGCYLCNCTFVLHRRRYCRMCLRAVCVSCSDRLFLPGFSEAKRVCLACCNLQMSLQKQPSRPIRQEAPPHQHRSADRDVSRDLDPPTRVDPSDMDALHAANRANYERMVQREQDRPLGIDDFDLMKVVGRGAFGKVMLVRKKRGKHAGAIFAMKILKKMHIIQNDQVENTKAEQHILKEISHPYVVRLRFSEDRTRLYMAQLLTAIMHLHAKDIAYRDLKLENILMDSDGHIALTDFGLSKEGQTVDGAIRASQAHGGMKTICGTAEYMAPELLRHQPYGKVVDWWSYGILMFEMLTGRTPFVDRNRRVMFKNIMTSDVVYPPYLSSVARTLIAKLLVRDPSKRLGSGVGGGRDIMADAFFAAIDWDALLRKEIAPSFVPDVSSADDVTNVPPQFQTMAALDSPVARDGTNPNHFEDFSYQEESRMDRRH
ncbi:AGC protein kinase, variant [Aphanomyces invadans]|uniref:AGC protein kinase, variant n=1 Tax=Aphanomyces invadans TaxID=157072 RepID=A0A024TDY8_9STRA|nr:AGC protein kinase, variant [Aphanomyces invadans]ETV92263.1 AGC protein kinase, variant [Aphanomyces invadans]|eukprot:XP_008879227.1 AGC protein kinase, variant [Aphanomyces invadans]